MDEAVGKFAPDTATRFSVFPDVDPPLTDTKYEHEDAAGTVPLVTTTLIRVTVAEPEQPVPVGATVATTPTSPDGRVSVN